MLHSDVRDSFHIMNPVISNMRKQLTTGTYDFVRTLDLYRIILIYKTLKFNIKNLEAFIDELTSAYLEFQNNKNLLNLDQIIVNLKRNTRFIKPKHFQEKADNYSNKFDNNKKKPLKKNNKYENRSQNSLKNNDEN